MCGSDAVVAPAWPQFGQVIRVSMSVTIAAAGATARASRLRQRLRQPRDVHGDAPDFVRGEQVGCGAPPRLLLEIDVGERLPVGVGAMKQASDSSTDQGGGKRRLPIALQEFHVDERFLLPPFRPHSVAQMHYRNWKV